MDVDEFVEEHGGRLVSEDTMGKYGRWIRRFESWRPKEPDEEVLRQWDSFLSDEDRADYPWKNARGRGAPQSYSFQSRVVSLSAVKLWLAHEHDIHIETEVQNIAEGEPAPFEPRTLSGSEIESVIRRAPLDCENDDCQTALRVGYDAIMRGAELADARVEDFDRGEGSLYVRAKKGSEPTTVELSDEAARALRNHVAARSGREYLFHNAYDNPWQPSSWNQHFRRKHHEDGFHCFGRHSPITNRLTSGEEFGQVYMRARHSNPTTTLKYVNYVGGDAPDWVG